MSGAVVTPEALAAGSSYLVGAADYEGAGSAAGAVCFMEVAAFNAFNLRFARGQERQVTGENQPVQIKL